MDNQSSGADNLPYGAVYVYKQIGKSLIRCVSYPKCVKCGSTSNNDYHWCRKCFNEHMQDYRKADKCLIVDDD